MGKNIFLALLLCTFLNSALMAEEKEDQSFRFGLHAGPGVSWISSDNPEITGNGVRSMFDFGLDFDYYFGEDDRYAFNTGLNLVMTGSKMKGTMTDTAGNFLSSTVNARINYLNIPLTLKLRTNQVGFLRFYGQLGMMPGFALRSRADHTFDENAGNGQVIENSVSNAAVRDIPLYPNVISRVSPFEVGLHTGAGIEYQLGEHTTLVGGLFFRTGLLNVFRDDDGARIVTRTIGIKAGITF